MRLHPRNLLLAAVLVGTAALAGTPRSWVSDPQSIPGPVPVSSSSGMDLRDIYAFRVSVCLKSGSALTGGELLLPWVVSPITNRWTPSWPNVLKVAIPEGITGQTLGSCFSWEDKEVGARQGRVYYQALGFASSVAIEVMGDARTAP